jgi:hypothetical protein
MSHPAAEHPAGHAGQPCWFIYYRVDMAELASAVAAARAGQARLERDFPGLVVELMQRPSASDDFAQMTLLEIYRAAADATPAQLADLPEAVERVVGVAVSPWLHGPRRVEVFQPCA